MKIINAIRDKIRDWLSKDKAFDYCGDGKVKVKVKVDTEELEEAIEKTENLIKNIGGEKMNNYGKEAFREGREACKKAEKFDDYNNPYDGGTKEFKLWNKGWNSVSIKEMPAE